MKKSKKAGIIAASVIIATGAFVILMIMASSITKPNEEKWKQVYTANSDIVKNTYITEDNCDSLFSLVNVPEQVFPENAVYEKDKLIGNTISCDIKSKEIITAGKVNYLAEMEYAQNRFNRCSEISINLESLDSALGGRVRKGDAIDIVIKCEDGKAKKLADNVHVSHAYDSNGVEITDASDNTTVATILTVLIEEENKIGFVECLSKGKACISKVLDKSAGNESGTVVYEW